MRCNCNWTTRNLLHKREKALSRSGERARLKLDYILVVVVYFGRRRTIKLARWTNGRLTRIRPYKPGGHVPVEMVHGVRVLRIGLVQFAGEDFRFLLQPSCPQVSHLAALVR